MGGVGSNDGVGWTDGHLVFGGCFLSVVDVYPSV